MDTVPLVVPVRFSGGGLSMQTTTSRLGTEGAFVRCVVSPKEGAEVTVQLQTPEPVRIVEFPGVVVERVQPGTKGKEMGFWVEFRKLAPESKKLLDLMLQKFVPQTKRGPDEGQRERAMPRAPARLEVRWKTPREFLVAYSENISEGGLYIATADQPALNEVIEIFLHLPDGNEPAKTMAQVVQCISPAQAAEARRSAGVGVQFVGADDSFRQRLELCMENLLTQA
jgi:uncharacterized protein (TIGR02266 family)